MFEDGGIFAIAFIGVYILFAVFISLILLICNWIIYNKAGKPGWACIIPFYNIIILLEIIDRPIWWFFLGLIPPVGFILGIIMTFDLAEAFGKDIGYGFGLLLLPYIFFPILAFGNAQYTGVERF